MSGHIYGPLSQATLTGARIRIAWVSRQGEVMTHHLVCALQGLPQLLSDLIELDYGVQTQVFFLFWAEYNALEFQ